MTLKVLLVDDEALARARLRTLLAECEAPAAVPAGEAANAAQAMELLLRQPVDAVLLDVHMPGADGLALAQALRDLPHPPAVVFVTAHAEHAVAAFELEAVDYLTKPVRRERLEAALQKVQRAMLARGEAPAAAPQVLLIHDRGRTERVPIDEVLYFKAELKYVTPRAAGPGAPRRPGGRRRLGGAAHRRRRRRRGLAAAARRGARGAGDVSAGTAGTTQGSPMREPGDVAKPAAAPLPADPEDPSHALLHVPVNVRSMSLGVLAVLASLAILHWAAAFFIPVMVGFLFSYALSPIVDWAERWRIPRAVGAAVLILGILGGTGASLYSFSDDANELIGSVPQAARKLRDSLKSHNGRDDTTLGSVQKAAAQLEQAAKEASPATPPTRGVQRVVIEKPAFDLRDYLWSGTLGLASFIGQVTVVTFLTYFLLLSGDTFRRKLVKIIGRTLSEKKITVQALDEIHGQIQRYMLVQLFASVLVGVTTALAFWALGLKHAAVWGFAAAILNLVPYIGSVMVTGAAGLIAFVQFGSINMALAVAGVSLLINTIEGNLLVPWLTSRAGRMNPVAVFIGVLGWGWLWGVWGLLLGIPILMGVKAVCDRVDDLKPIGELLGT